jgi:TolB protein
MIVTILDSRFFFVLCALLVACGTHSGPSARVAADHAERGGPGGIPIAVVPFGLAAGSTPATADVAAIIRADLVATGRYAPLPVDELPAHPDRLSEVAFETWRRSKARYLVVGLVASVHDGGHEVEFRLIDPREEKTLVGFLVPSAPDALEETAHRIANLIEERIGERPSQATGALRDGASRTKGTRIARSLPPSIAHRGAAAPR